VPSQQGEPRASRQQGQLLSTKRLGAAHGSGDAGSGSAATVTNGAAVDEPQVVETDWLDG